MDMTEIHVIKQHLIDPEICIRCNTCEAICPVQAITHDSRNYVVDAEKCNFCMACISPCPTGSIDNWRTMPRVKAYSLEAQLGWDELPPELTPEELAAEGVAAGAVPDIEPVAPSLPAASNGEAVFNSAQYGATLPPWSAAHAYTNLYGPKTAEKSSPPPSPAMCGSPRSAATTTTRTTSCWTSAKCRFRCSKASPSASFRRALTPAAGRILRASIRLPARATASGPATTTSR